MSRRTANVITAAGLLALMVGVAWSAPRWSRLLTRSIPGAGTDEEEPAAQPSPEELSRAVERQINVKLFFPSAERPGLAIEERPVAFSGDLSRQLYAVVEELLRGPGEKTGGVSAYSANTKVLEVFFSPRGTAYVDLSKEAGEGHAGSEAELIAVYSVVDSLVANFPAVKRVQILLEDKPVATLAGHVDLTRPLGADMTLLADVAQPPGANPPPRGAP